MIKSIFVVEFQLIFVLFELDVSFNLVEQNLIVSKKHYDIVERDRIKINFHVVKHKKINFYIF